MTQRKALYGSTALFVLLANSALADVTAQQVWDNMTNFYGTAGYEISTGSVDSSGGTLTVTDMKIAFPNPYADLQAEIAIEGSAMVPSLVLTENGDGTVKVEISDVYTMGIDITPEGEDTGRIGLSVDQTGIEMVAEGDPDKVTYIISGPSLNVTLDKIEIPGEDEINDAFNAAITLSNYSGTYTLGSGDKPTLDMNFAAADMGGSVVGQEPDGPGRLDMSFEVKALDWITSGVYAQGDKPGDMTAMLKAGMTSTGTMSHGGAAYNFLFNDRGDNFAMEGSSSSGKVDFNMDAAGMAYNIGNTDWAIKASGSEIPFPEVTASAGATLFGITMPVLASDNPQDLGIRLRLEDLSISDMIWSMLDPSGQLPRDPATLVVELAGKANWFFDIMDPEAMAAMDSPIPGALHEMNITEVRLSAVGAEAKASGAFSFDMNNFSPAFGGMPAPTGALDVEVNGANGLMDKLVGMGLLGQEEVMGARMMLGLFARPGAGDDSLISKIEVDGATGAVSANGQRLQ